eukprot:1970821-Alexandrium_andersonii.AAC.1
MRARPNHEQWPTDSLPSVLFPAPVVAVGFSAQNGTERTPRAKFESFPGAAQLKFRALEASLHVSRYCSPSRAPAS